MRTLGTLILYLTALLTLVVLVAVPWALVQSARRWIRHRRVRHELRLIQRAAYREHRRQA